MCLFIGLKNNKLHCKCQECKKIQLKSINRLIKNFPNIHQFCNGYEYMDSWKKFDEAS